MAVKEKGLVLTLRGRERNGSGDTVQTVHQDGSIDLWKGTGWEMRCIRCQRGTFTVYSLLDDDCEGSSHLNGERETDSVLKLCAVRVLRPTWAGCYLSIHCMFHIATTSEID
jgi:hypothetical protein